MPKLERKSFRAPAGRKLPPMKYLGSVDVIGIIANQKSFPARPGTRCTLIAFAPILLVSTRITLSPIATATWTRNNLLQIRICQSDSGFPRGLSVTLVQAEPEISTQPSANIQNSIHPRQKYPDSCKRPLSLVLAGLFSSSNQKNHLHSFFCGCRIRDGSGTRGYRSFFCLRKVPVFPWGAVYVTSSRLSKAVDLSPRSNTVVCRRVLPSLQPGLNVPFAHRFDC
jgi:hypothetical protein